MGTNDTIDIRFTEAQFLSKILLTKDIRLITENGIDQNYFTYFKNEFNFIYDHYEKYKAVPDSTTVALQFKDWEYIDVQEPDEYLVNSLIRNKRISDVINKTNKIREAILNNDFDRAFEIEGEKLDYSAKGYLTEVEDVFGPTLSESRLNEYTEKMQRPGSYYISTGFKELDDAFGGGWDRKEEFATIVARPGVGKSWIMLTSAYAASCAGLRVGIFSGEMSKNKVGFRLDTLASHISNAGISHGKRNVQNEYESYIQELKKEKRGPIFITTIAEDFGGKTPTINDFETFINKYNLDIFFLDQQSLMEDLAHSKNPIDKAGNIAKELKLLQTTCQIPLITVCQQNRTGEQAVDKNGNHKDVEYDVSRISQSDKIGQYSTIVLFLEYDKELKILGVHPAKVRDSGCSKLQYYWDIDKGTFSYIATEMIESEENTEESEELRQSFEGNQNSDLIF